MKSYLASALIVVGLTAPAWAQSEIDADGDGLVTLEEVQAVYPEITSESFAAMDANADGALDDEEMVAAQEAGTMPKS